MSNKTALTLLANSREFDEKYKAIHELVGILGSFTLRSIPLSRQQEAEESAMKTELAGEFSDYKVLIFARRKKDVLQVEFDYRHKHDLVLGKFGLSLAVVRYLYDNMDIFVRMARDYTLKHGDIEEFDRQMARFEVQ